MIKKNNRGKRFIAGLLLFTMVSSVVADCNIATAFAADNKLNISESEIVIEKEDYQNDVPTESNTISNQNNIPVIKDNNISDKDNSLNDDNHEDGHTITNENTHQNKEDIQDISKNDELEVKKDSEEIKEEDSNPASSEESKETEDFDKELIVDGYKVEIKAAEGVFPDGTRVEIETVDTIGDEDATDVISEEMEEKESEAEIVKSVTFDINFYSKDGKIIEPENGSVSIIITPDLQEVSELQEMENELGTSLECSVFHVDDELNVEEVECEITEDYTEVSFDAESFSKYTVIWYATPDADGYQVVSKEGPRYIGDNFEKVPFGFSDFKVQIAWTNDDGDTDLRPTELSFTVYGTDLLKPSEQVKICDITLDYDGTSTSIDLADYADIPVYVKRGTGKKESGGSATYDMEGFKYEVKLHDENTAYKSDNPIAELKTDREPNDPVWYASAKSTITSKRIDLADASFKIEWYDNNNETIKGGARPRPYYTDDVINETELKKKIALYYYTDEDETRRPVTKDMMPAGVEATGPNISKDSYSTWSISYEKLLPKDENGNTIKYVLKLPDNSEFAPKYTSDNTENTYINDKGTRKYLLLGDFEAKICWNDGGMEDYLRPESALEFVVTDSEGNIIKIPSEDITITSKDKNIWQFKVDNLVMYSDEGVLSYYVTLNKELLKEKNYKVSYTNAPKSTDVSKCHHEDGTIFITLINDLDGFTIHKKWVDGIDGDTADIGRRDFINKGVTLYLWRYPVKKKVGDNIVTGTIADGAPVNNANGEQYSYELKKNNDNDKHSKNFDLHLRDFVGEDGSLDMYDTQGYQYVYYVTEIMNGDEYVTSYSNVNPYTHIETAVADGGSLINLRKESIKIEGIVKWKVPSVTDYTKAAATICLQRFDVDSNKWVNVGSPVTVAGFTEADPQKKHVFPAVDKFDEKGREIKYRVIETNINYDGNDINVEKYPDTSADNKYVAEKYEMNDFFYTATAHPTYPTPKSEAEKYSFTVDNRMSGDVNLDIKKIWKTKKAYDTVSGYRDITINIIQKNYKGDIIPNPDKPYGTVKVTGVADNTGAVPSGYATLTIDEKDTKIPITVKPETIKDGETNLECLVWTFGEIKLPEFDSEGRAYTYSIKENSIDNTHASYEYAFNGRDIIATANNSYVPSGGGNSLYFEIDKEWIDGADLSQRQPVTVAIVNVDPATGKYSLEDNAHKKHEFVLSAENNWHQEVWLSEYINEAKTKKRFNIDGSGNYLWTVIEEDVTLRAEYEKIDGWDLTAADDEMDEIHRQVTGYPEDLLSGGIDVTSITGGKVAAIVHNDIHKPGYDVTIEAADDHSVFGASKYKITNRRAGEVNITFDKTWHDSYNKADTRGEALKVYLYQDEKRVVTTQKEEDDDPDNCVYISGITTPMRKDYSHIKNGDDGNSDTFKFEHLPKYDDHGVAYLYSVREFMVREDEHGDDEEIEILTYDTEDTTLSGYVADIENHEATVTFEKSAEKLIRNELYKYHNTLTGKMTTGVPFHVIWHDQSSYDNGERPDMYFTLYYRTIGSTDDQIKKFDGDYKVIWEADKETIDGEEIANPYYKTATFIGLPVADEEGNAYEFFAAPSLNNAADHYDKRYFINNTDVKLENGENGTVVVEANQNTHIHHYDIRKGESDDSTKPEIITLSDGTKLLPAGGLIEYIIDEKISPKGKKTWKNVKQGITVADLPDAKIYLGRYSDHDKDTNKLYSKSDLSDLNLSKKLEDTLLNTDTDKLSFEFTGAYDKYDYYGQIYTYQLAEEIFVTGSTTYKLPNYIMEYNQDSFNLVNKYLGEKNSSRSIKVTKKWGKVGETSIVAPYPVARFKLYRKEVNPSNCDTSGLPSGTIPYNPDTTQYGVTSLAGFTACDEEIITITYNPEGKDQTKSWNDLPIYAPSGKPYFYAVEEISTHGMEAYTITNDASESANGVNRDNRKIGTTGQLVLISNNGLIPDKTYDEATENQQSVEFTNTLKDDNTINKITGTKVWSDSPYTLNVRPEPGDCNTGVENQQIKLELRRSAASQTGAGNSVSSKTLKEGEDYKVTWNKTADNDKWSYEIVPIKTNEFQIYAPNGRPYTYTVTEKLAGVAADNYKATTASAGKLATNFTREAEANILKLGDKPLKNTLKGQIQMFKKWDDALNEYNLRSGYVKFILQYREVGKDEVEGSNTSNNWITYKENGTDASVYELRYDPDKWKKSVSNLPVKSKDGDNVYEYRVLEVEFEDHQVPPNHIYPVIYNATENPDKVEYKPNKNSEYKDTVPKGGASYKNSTRFEGHFETKAGNYIVSHSKIANLTKENTRMLQIENFLSEKKSLVVEKKWDGIKSGTKEDGTKSDDIYEVLPDQITFKIQYTTNKDDESSWKDLYEKNTTKNVTVTVYKANDWKQLAELPEDTADQETYYRAIELGTNLGRFEGYHGEGIPMSEKSADPGVVHKHYAEHIPGESESDYGSIDCSTIATNTLATRNITVRKKWNDDKDAVHGDVDIELLSANYDTGDDDPNLIALVPGTKATLKESEGYEFTYHNLPSKNKNGKNIVYYVKEVNVDGAAYNADKYDTAFFVSANSLSYSQVPANSGAYNIASVDRNGTAKAVCIVNTPKSTLSVTKKWNDEDNRHNQRSSVIFNLADDNKGLWTSIKSDKTNRTYEFVDKLPIYKAPDPAFVITENKFNMGKVTYKVTEDNSVIASHGYKTPVYTVNGVNTGAAGVITLDKASAANNVHILNEKNPPKATITADKKWVDENKRHGSRTSQVDLSLYYRVGISDKWTLVTNKHLGEDGNYPDGNIYTTSEVTQSLSQNEADSKDSNLWVHNSKFATWTNLPTYKGGKIVYYKVFETNGTPATTLSTSYTGDFSGYSVTYSDKNGSSFTNVDKPKNQTITNTLKRTKILVEKQWGDTVDQKIRPYSVTFKLEYKHANKPWKTYTEEDGKDKLIVVTGEHNQKTWSQVVDNLPFADCEGHEYEYRLKEVSMLIKTPSGYKVVEDLGSDDSNFTGLHETQWNGEIGTYDNEVTVAKSTDSRYNYKATAVNTPDVGSITVTKVWDDNDNRDGIRPDTIEVTLYRDGKAYAEVEMGASLATTIVTDGNKWTYTWNNLPMYKDDAGVHDAAHMSVYYVVEDSISDDEVHKYKAPTYGLLEDSITNIYASHVQSHVSDDAATTDLWIKNTHDPIRFKIDAYKKWDDSKTDKEPEHRPSKIELELQYRIYGSGSTTWSRVDKVLIDALNTSATIVGTTSDNPQTVMNSNAIEGHSDIWMAPSGWDNLPAYFIYTDKKTKLIEYRIEEKWFSDDNQSSYYEVEHPHFHYDIAEAKIEGKDYPKDPLIVENMADYNSTITVIKEWNEKELLEKYGVLPSELHVKLQWWKDGEWKDYTDGGYNPAIILKEHEDERFENSWTHTFQWLNKDYKYRIKEEKIVFKNGEESFEIPSSGIIDNDVLDLGDGKGNATIGDFKIKVIAIKELGLTDHSEGGELGAPQSKHWVAELKNSLPNRKIQVKKKWNDEKDRDKLRPTHVYVTLQRDGENIETVMLHDANSWTHVWDNLPLHKYGSSTEMSVYSVIETDEHGNEVAPTGYEVSYAINKPGSNAKLFDLSEIGDGQQAEITITNTHKPAKTTVYAGKEWDDESNKYGVRTDTIYLALFYKYQHEGNEKWRLIGKVNETDLDSNGLYKDSLIHTTSDPVKAMSGQLLIDNWESAMWENLPSRAVDETGAVRIPEYKVVEVKAENKNISAGDKLSTLGDTTNVIPGYKTTQPEEFFVSEDGGDSKGHIVKNELKTVSARIIKKWDDQNNKFANRPERIEFAIQQKGSDGWKLLKEKINGENVERIVSVSSENLVDDNTWELLVEGLPEYDKSGNKFSYRAVETSLVYADGKIKSVFSKDTTDVSLKKETFANNGYKTEEAYTGVEVEGKYTTEITNTQDKSAKLTVKKKVWEDYDNARKTRPVSIIFEVEKKPVPGSKVEEIIATIVDFFKENDGWERVYELNGAGEKVVATITLDNPEFDEVSLVGLPLYDENGKELVYRAREIQLVYENGTIDIASSANPYQAPTYEDSADESTPSYTTEATNKIKPDPSKPHKGDPEPGAGPEIPPILPPKDPEKPVLPPELEDIEEKIKEIDEPEDVGPIVEELLDLPDSPEKDYVVKELWVVVSTMANDPSFYSHFDPEMQDILKRFVKSGVLGRRRGLPKTGGLKGSFVLLLMGFALIGIGNGFINKKKRKK